MRILLLFLFFVLLSAATLGLDLSLAPGLSVKNALLYVAFLGIAIDTALRRNRSVELPSVIIPLVLCIAYAAFTWLVIVLVVDYSGYSTLGSLVQLKSGFADHLIVFLVFFYGVMNAKDAIWLAKGMVWIVVFANLISVMDALNLPDLGLIHEREDGRIGGPIGESNQYAVFISLFLPGMVALTVCERGRLRALAAVGLCISTLALVLTASRGGMLGLIAGSFLGFILLRRFLPLRAMFVTLGALMLFILFSIVVAYLTGYGELLYDRFVGQAVGGGHEISSGRTTIWAIALEKMFDAPLTLVTGYGWNAYVAFRDFGYAPHNSYLGVYFELGIIGLALLLFSYANIVRVSRAALGYAPHAAFAFLVAFIFGFLAVLIGVFFVELGAPWLFIWAYAGIFMRLSLAVTNVDAASADDLDPTAAGPELVGDASWQR